LQSASRSATPGVVAALPRETMNAPQAGLSMLSRVRQKRIPPPDLAGASHSLPLMRTIPHDWPTACGRIKDRAEIFARTTFFRPLTLPATPAELSAIRDFRALAQMIVRVQPCLRAKRCGYHLMRPPGWFLSSTIRKPGRRSKNDLELSDSLPQNGLLLSRHRRCFGPYDRLSNYLLAQPP